MTDEFATEVKVLSHDIFDDCQLTNIEDVWISLDVAIASALGNALDYFRANQNGYPGGSNQAEWDAVLKEMSDSFRLYSDADDRHNQIAGVKKALALLSDHFVNLWD